MIVRETEKDFICIDQNHHAEIAKQIISQWKNHFLADDTFKENILYAIEQHDVGWHYFDKQPLWNDETNKPYTFIDLPLLIKTVLYTHGVDIVERKDPYAAALCSAHYTKFLQKYEVTEVQQYLTNEKVRRDKILQALPEISQITFKQHLALLQLADNMSLFICLHDPGNNDAKHRYFQSGIRIPKAIDKQNVEFIATRWKNETIIQLENINYVEPFSVFIQEKTVPKKQIKKEGFAKSYEQAPPIDRKIHFQISQNKD